jgi:hypothetical protein
LFDDLLVATDLMKRNGKGVVTAEETPARLAKAGRKLESHVTVFGLPGGGVTLNL